MKLPVKLSMKCSAISMYFSIQINPLLMYTEVFLLKSETKHLPCSRLKEH